MTTKVTVFCDRCNKEIPEKDWPQIWVVQVLVTDRDTYNRQAQTHNLNKYLKDDRNRQEWCRPCADELNLFNVAWKAPVAAPLDTPPTFEDKLRESVREEIEDLRTN